MGHLWLFLVIGWLDFGKDNYSWQFSHSKYFYSFVKVTSFSG